MTNKLVSVNIVVYNGARFIADAIQSIIDQTYTDFELIIVDDGSTDKTVSIIETFNDKRIHIIKHKKNLGSLNARITALDASNGEYIAILDADDIAMPNRLKIQSEFLKKNTDYGLVGGIAEIIDENGDKINKTQSISLSAEQTKVYLLFKNCFTHSAVMYRKKMLNKFGFEKEVILSEDYDVITKIATEMKVMNLPEIVVQYRKHNRNISRNNYKIAKNQRTIISNQISFLGITPSKNNLDIHIRLTKKNTHTDLKLIQDTSKWLDTLFTANRYKKIFPEPAFYNRLSGYWFNLMNNPSIFQSRLLITYLSSPILWHSNHSIFKHIRFVIKCLIKWKPRASG